MDLNSGFMIGRVRGIAIRVHWSWVIIFLLVTWNLQGGVLPGLVPDWSPQARLVGGVVAALAFFLSVLLHELSHAFVALHYGMRVPSITLFLFGGVSNIDGEMRTPGQEFRIAIAGPATSIAIGLALGAVWWFVDFEGVEILWYLAFINIILGIFNLVPGFPLDGGRVLRALVWASTGDLTRSTRIAARSGTVVAWGMIALGVYVALNGNLAGLWYVLIGLFLKTAADTAYGQMLLERALEGVYVRDVMRGAPDPVDPATRLQRVVDERVIGRGERAIFVGDASAVIGLFTIADLAAVPPEELGTKTAREIMVPAEQIITVLPGTALLEATRAMTERDVHQLPVVEDGRMVGVLSRGDVLQQLEVRQRFGRIDRDRRDGVR
ncbi:MAG: M50 family metallopeptidase [Dehalococcoidia bacterium]